MPAWLIWLAKLLLPVLLQWLLRERLSKLPPLVKETRLAAFRLRVAGHVRKGDLKKASAELHAFICELDETCARLKL